jgi:hypothetical protein
MPTGWFTEPVRAWWPDFRSDLCTPGHPLCILTPKAIFEDRREVSLQRMTSRAYHFRRVDGRISAVERIWKHLRDNGGSLTESEAADMAACTVPQVHALLHAALSACALVVKRGPGGSRFELGPVAPKEVPR